MQVEVWSDVLCPWCYIGKRRLEGALERFPGRDAVTVTWRSFELDPDAPRASPLSMTELLAKKYGRSAAEAEAMQAHVTGIAAGDGLEYHLDRTHPENSFDAHRLLHHARASGKGEELQERLFAAYFTEGRRIGDHAVLADLAAEAGLDRDQAAAVLADPSRFADDVRREEAEARQLGVRGVPFFVIDRRYGVSGAQPVEALLAALSRASG